MKVQMSFRDLRALLRSLTRSWSFTLLTVGILALGIGASIAAFSIVSAVLLKPLPYPHSERVFVILDKAPPQMNLGFNEFPLSGSEFQFIAANHRTFESVAAFKADQFNLSQETDLERVAGIRASAEFFKVLGIEPQTGRTFTALEDQPGSERVVLISYSLWQRRFAGDPHLPGKTIRLNSEPYTVIGVMPKGFEFPRGAEMPKSMQFPKRADLWVPLALSANPRGPSDLTLIARSKPGISLGQSTEDLKAINRNFVEQDPRYKGWADFKLVPLRDQVEDDAKPRILMMAGSVLFVLLIACGNVSNLLLTRSLGRIKDSAVRSALGAQRKALIQQLLIESVFLALLGAAAGLGLSALITNAVKNLFSQYVPRLNDVHLDLTVIFFSTALAVIVGLFFGIFPALHISGSNLIEYLRSREQKHSSQRIKAFRNAMVAGQIAMSLVLAIGSGLLVRSLIEILKADPGFQSGRLVTMDVTLPGARYADLNAIENAHHQILDRLSQIPGIQSAALVQPLPMAGTQEETVFTIDGRPPIARDKLPLASYTIVSPDYFETANIPLRGRAFTDADNESAPLAVIISDAMTRQFWPREDPVGRYMSLPNPRWQHMRIVGVAANVKKFALTDTPGPEMYVPYQQHPYPSMLTMPFVVRTSRTAEGLSHELQQAVRAVDSELPVADVQTMAELISWSMSPQRLSAMVMGAFSGIALILALVGLYAVVSYSVRERTHDIGVRIALGAGKNDILRLVFGQGARLIGTGLIIGFVLALGFSRVLASFVYGIKAIDPLTFVVTPLGLLLAAMFAIYFPARRAGQLDPVRTLRNE